MLRRMKWNMNTNAGTADAGTATGTRGTTTTARSATTSATAEKMRLWEVLQHKRKLLSLQPEKAKIWNT